MNKVFKFVIAPVLAIILLAPLLVPLILGFQIKNEFLTFKDRIPPNSGYSLLVDEYNRGWFSSTNKITLHIVMLDKNRNNDSKLPETVDITFANTIHHGPFIYSKKDHKFKFARAYVESTIVTPNIPINFTAVWKFGGSMLTLAKAENITFKLGTADDTSVVLQGIDFSQNSKHDFNKVDTHFSLSALDAFDKDEGRLKVQNITHNSSFNKVELAFWSGHGETSIAKISLDSKKNNNAEIQGFMLNQVSDVNSGRAKGSMEVSINSVNLNGKDYGKQEVSMSVDNLDVDSLNTLTQALEEQPQNDPLLPVGKTYRSMLMLLSKGLHVSLDKLDVNTKWGRVNADADIDLAQSSTKLLTLQELSSNLKAAANIVIPNDLVHQIINFYLVSHPSEQNTEVIDPKIVEQTLQQWIDAGWLVKDNDNYKVKLRIEKMVVTINDKPFQFPKDMNNASNAPELPGATSAIPPAAATAPPSAATTVPPPATKTNGH